MKTLIKLDRLSAWILFASMLLYFISGYGMTKGIISREFATKVHIDYLTYIILIVFIFHSAFAIRLALMRWGVWKWGKYLWIVFYLIFISAFVYVDRAYQPKLFSTNSTAISSSQSAQATKTSSIKTFTLAELAEYNGQNGQPAYVAVDGNVYDLTSVFQTGKHFSHFAGTELSNAFYSYHAKSALSKYPIVGKLSN